jgi:hypothetical protein
MNARRSRPVLHRGVIVALVAAFMASLAICGCKSSSKSVIQEQTVYKTEAAPGEAEKTIKETTIIKEKESHGLVGRFFILIGDVVALPFRMIAMVFDTVI